ncbi:cysteine desulfurase family protein [Niabella sp. 22666]|uniref:cysteine desulfurase family protein n=1 Tax=Niabella sp. 22666 TaxID=3453954 RepID=UPI003F82E4C3
MDDHRFIYLDNNATTPVDPRVLEAMMPFLTSAYGNAASNHIFGVQINQQVKEARGNMADLLGCDATEIIFTSGATEAINLAIKGVAKEYKSKGNHIITVTTEHPAVLDTCKSLESEGYEITYLPVKRDGIIDQETLAAAIKPETILISVMMVNNETGVIQPIKEIAALAHENDIFFMTDATQAVGKLPINVQELGIDLLACSGHKFYGPKGIGALYVRSKRPFKVKLPALLHGGGHERGMRSGTLNVPGIVGMGEAAKIAHTDMMADAKRVSALRDELEKALLEVEGSFVNGNLTDRLYNVSNICFEGADADAIIAGLEEVMLSNGSACSSTKIEPSHVLSAMRLSDDQCYASIRLSLGRFTTKEDITDAIPTIKKIVTNLKIMNE